MPKVKKYIYPVAFFVLLMLLLGVFLTAVESLLPKRKWKAILRTGRR